MTTYSHEVTLGPPTPRRTRYPELGFRQDGPRLWRIIDLCDDMASAVGPFYATRAELFGDLARYAGVFGCAPQEVAQ